MEIKTVSNCQGYELRFYIKEWDMEGKQGLKEQNVIRYHGKLSVGRFIWYLCVLINNAHIYDSPLDTNFQNWHKILNDFV